MIEEPCVSGEGSSSIRSGLAPGAPFHERASPHCIKGLLLGRFLPIFTDLSDFLGRFRVIVTRIHLHPRESGEDRHRIGEIHDDYLGKS